MWLYRSYLKERRQRDEAHRRVAYSNNTHIESPSIQIEPSGQLRVLTPKEIKDRKAEKNMFFMALTLSTISVISRVLLMICFVYFLMFITFYNSLILFFINSSIQVLVPTSDIFVFYFFNKMFRQEFKKRISTSIVASSSAQR